MNKGFIFFLLCLLAWVFDSNADNRHLLSSLRAALEANSSSSVQEKVYIHTDNTCYFVGDTIWYKAYVTRADNLHETDMSHILYVELLTPDGFVKERQNIIISNDGFSSGCIPLQDSLYSGFYELRAYTRWMLNFNVTEHRFGREIKHAFYNIDMARDFFRQWDGLYSRVLPIYSKPDSLGNYTYKRMYGRPKQRMAIGPKERLCANFYPEGGHLIKGVANRVAFELQTPEGESVDLSGELMDGDVPVSKIKTDYMGRGSFVITPKGDDMKAHFVWNSKEYSFRLPSAEDSGVALRLEDGTVKVSSRRLPSDRQYGLSILCRGSLKHFEEIRFDGKGRFVLALPSLPTGVNDITVFDSDGNVLADRLFFVNNHDYDSYTVSVDSGMKSSYMPYEEISLRLHCEGIDTVMPLSVSVRDGHTDEPSYDDGDIMTDMLLSSELKGFIAYPSYYFSSDDAAHRKALDLLMLVQGWRKYKWEELSDSAFLSKRYAPESTMTVEGGVYKLVDQKIDFGMDEISTWESGMASDNTEDSYEGGSLGDVNDLQKTTKGGQLKGKAVCVEAELSVGKDVAGLSQMTDKNGHFIFQIPPFYGVGTLNMTAYAPKDSARCSLQAGKLKGFLDETKWPDYYVKRDLFYPRFSTKYNFYQNHIPDIIVPVDTISDLQMENTNNLLRNVNVKGRWHGKRGIDYKKPAFVEDAYVLYNDVTDYGLSYGVYNKKKFPVQICHYLFGNMGRANKFNIDARMDGIDFNNYVFFRTYEPEKASIVGMSKNSTKLTELPYGGYGVFSLSPNKVLLEKKTMLKYLSDIRVFTDYEPRNEDIPMEQNSMRADATVVYTTFPNDSEQLTYRDRHIILPGFDYPFDFYNPDYSVKTPDTPSDYRRTLYWNPNVKTDNNGNATVKLFNNSKETRIKVNACGITADGHFVRFK